MSREEKMNRIVSSKIKFDANKPYSERSCYNAVTVCNSSDLNEIFTHLIKQSKQRNGSSDYRFVLSADDDKNGVLIASLNHDRVNHHNLAIMASAGGLIAYCKPIKVNGKKRLIRIDNYDASHNPEGMAVFTNIVLYLRSMGSDREVLLVKKGHEKQAAQLTAELDFLYSLSPAQAKTLYLYGFGDYPEILPLLVNKFREEKTSDNPKEILSKATDLLISKVKAIDNDRWETLKVFVSAGKNPINLKESEKPVVNITDESLAKCAKSLRITKAGLFRDAALSQGYEQSKTLNFRSSL